MFVKMLFLTLLFFPLSSAEEKPLHLFILSGQSNMARLNPDESFTPAVQKEFGADNVIVVKDAVGGMPIRRWYKKWKSSKDKEEDKGKEKKGTERARSLYDKLMKKVREAVGQKKPTTITFIWMQGESDAIENEHAVYEDSLKGLVQQVRDDLNHKNINVIIGRLSDARVGKVGWDSIRKIQEEICEADKHWEWVDTDDLNGKKNGVHYSKEGYKTLGTRFAEKSISLVKAN